MELHACPGPSVTDRADRDLKDLWAEIAANQIVEWYFNPDRRSGPFNPDSMPGISADIRSTLDKLGGLFGTINNDGDVRLSRSNELEIIRHLWKYLAVPPSRYLSLQPALRQLHGHLVAAANLMSNISDTSCPADEYVAWVAGLEDTLRDHARLVRYELLEKGKVGAPLLKGKRLSLVNGLAGVYRSAGGRATTSWDDDGKSVKGGFANFLVRVWDVLPPHTRPPTAATFARLAKQVDPKLRGKKILS